MRKAESAADCEACNKEEWYFTIPFNGEYNYAATENRPVNVSATVAVE